MTHEITFTRLKTSDSEMYLHKFVCVFAWWLGVSCISHENRKSNKLYVLVAEVVSKVVEVNFWKMCKESIASELYVCECVGGAAFKPIFMHLLHTWVSGFNFW